MIPLAIVVDAHFVPEDSLWSTCVASSGALHSMFQAVTVIAKRVACLIVLLPKLSCTVLAAVPG
eukprot:2756365-Alexandrium_andersonii.AAC.1